MHEVSFPIVFSPMLPNIDIIVLTMSFSGVFSNNVIFIALKSFFKVYIKKLRYKFNSVSLGGKALSLTKIATIATIYNKGETGRKHDVSVTVVRSYH